MNPFVKWLISPLAEYHLTSLQHKLFIGVVGAGVGYYLYSKKYENWQVALGALGAAYVASMLLHAAQRFAEPALPGGLPQQVVQVTDSVQQVAQTAQAAGKSLLEETLEQDASDEGSLEGIFNY